MTGREAKTHYHIREWAEKFRERAHSGQSVRMWCAENGVSGRIYYYWLRKVREYATQVMVAIGGESAAELGSSSAVRELTAIEACATTELSVPEGWTVCALPETPKLPAKMLPIEIGQCRVMADADVDPELLVKVCKALVTLC